MASRLFPLEFESPVRSFWAGAALGAALSVLDLVFGGGLDGLGSSGSKLGSAGLVVSGVAGAYGLASAGLFVCAGLAPKGRGRTLLRVGGGGALLILLGVVHLISLFLERSSGSFLSLGAIEFCVLSPEACSSEAFRTHAWALVVVVVAALVCGSLGCWAARRDGSGAQGPSRSQPLALAFAGVSVAALSWAITEPRVSAANAELALISSALVESELLEAAEAVAGPPFPSGLAPEQSEHAEWLAAASEKSLSPNVVLVMLESVPARKFGFAGNTRQVTPNMDRLAAASVRFRRAWTTATHSNYAQMAVLSSLFPRRRGGLDTYTELDYPRFLFHDIFAALGYETGTISSQDERWQGMRRFQETGTKTHYFHAPDHPGVRFGDGHGQSIPDAVTQGHASDWIRRYRGEKWALYLNFQGTHFPYHRQPGAPRPFEPSDVDASTFSYLKYPEGAREAANNRYDNALHWIDTQIGALIDTLKQTDQWENTLWAFTSDHGELFGEHELVTHGRTLFDAEARVPFFLYWPRGLKSEDRDSPVSTLDVLPSILGAIGVPPHPSFQGTDRISDPGAASRKGVFMNIQGLRTAEAVVCWPWKAIILRPSGETSLYDLAADPEETTNLRSVEPRIAETLELLVRAHTSAQMQYHRQGSELLKSHYAPRLASCPDLPRSGGRRHGGAY